MNEFLPIKNNVSRFIQLTEEEQEYFVSLLRISKIKKRQFIVQPEFICEYRSYIVKGAMRAYLADNESKEHTIALAIEDWWIGDISSYIFQEPATFFVEALEDSELIQLSYNNEQLLLENIPKFERYFRIIAQRGIADMQKRMLSNISKSAEKRYEEFSKSYPQFLQRFPQHIIASYLGITKETLSRIRKSVVKK